MYRTYEFKSISSMHDFLLHTEIKHKTVNKVKLTIKSEEFDEENIQKLLRTYNAKEVIYEHRQK